MSATLHVAALSALVVIAVNACAHPRVSADRNVAFTYGPHLSGSLYLPPGPQPHTAALVVLVPGGGWTSADPTGLIPLAKRLAATGFVAATTTYRAGPDALFPTPVADIECAVETAAAQSRKQGISPAPIVVLGHSAGAQLSALAALNGTQFRARCAAPAVNIHAFIGLSGPYDISKFPGAAQSLLGTSPAQDPGRWRAANPLTWAHRETGLAVLLAYGTDDTVVAPSFTAEFAQALRAGGHRVQVLSVDGATHASIYEPDTAAAQIITWVRGLAA